MRKMTSELGLPVDLHVIDGNPGGLLTVKVDQRGLFIIKTSRLEIAKALEQEQANYKGVYILLGKKNDMPLAYVGKAEKSLGERLRIHVTVKKENKNWWTEAILITTPTDHLDKSTVSYLESCLVDIARSINPKSLENKQKPSNPYRQQHSKPRREAKGKDFLNALLVVLPALGVDIFLDRKRVLEQEDEKKETDKNQAGYSRPIFELASKRGSHYNAEAVIDRPHFVIRAGSLAKKEWKNEAHAKGTQKVRADLINKKILKNDGDNFKFTEDYAFDSASAAARVVVARNANGLDEWRLKGNSNQTLKDWEKGNVKQAKPRK